MRKVMAVTAVMLIGSSSHSAVMIPHIGSRNADAGARQVTCLERISRVRYLVMNTGKIVIIGSASAVRPC